MKTIQQRGEEARRYILDHVEKHPADLAKAAAEHFGISRQAVNRYIQKLYEEGALTAKGRTRNRSYALAPLVEWHGSYEIKPGLQEDVVWSGDIAPRLGHLAQNVADIWQYGFTEMFNNAIEHSGGSSISVYVTRTAAKSELMILDNGAGIFRKIQNALNLIDERHAILELSKGKFTTAPVGHTGEGIFFTSRLFDSFDILSGGLYYTHTFGEAEGWLTEAAKTNDGTLVWLKLRNHTARTMHKVMTQFSSEEDDYQFSKTVVPVKLAKYGNEQLVSRSQAKRLVARVEVFSTVIFDFEGVDFIGQAFADEVFRVFASQHPEVKVYAIHANSEVKRMIARANAARNAQAHGEPPGVKDS